MKNIYTTNIIIKKQLDNNEYNFSDWILSDETFLKKDIIYDILKVFMNHINEMTASIIIQCSYRKYKSKLYLIKLKQIKDKEKNNKIKVVKGSYKGFKGYLIKKTKKKVKVCLYINNKNTILYLNKNSIKKRKKHKLIKKRLGLVAKCIDTNIIGIIVKETKLNVDLYVKDYDRKGINSSILHCKNIKLVLNREEY